MLPFVFAIYINKTCIYTIHVSIFIFRKRQAKVLTFTEENSIAPKESGVLMCTMAKETGFQ